mmetsp:Transcript_34007/g.80726  ORF Transcript_34007/g.80726 Transcript_34007/m.80726 type:complete len:94 (-) Transcript_34007:402-683(-)
MRDRRPPLFGAHPTEPQDSDYDAEAMEKENDRSISDMGERVSMLKNITKGIHDEVQGQHSLLDNMVLAPLASALPLLSCPTCSPLRPSLLRPH